MSVKMLVDAQHPEETRVVILDGAKIQEFDIETSTKKQVKGNVYLAKVTRIEPSLQAAFVEYGGNRQGFLPFSEIHPDYYQIPVADREQLIREEEEREREEEGEVNERQPESLQDEQPSAENPEEEREEGESASGEEDSGQDQEREQEEGHERREAEAGVEVIANDEPYEPERKRRVATRRYKIQEVIKKNQVILIQVVKEERGNKGASLTTYISIPGRYCVLMPNTNRGGGVSRKITDQKERNKLKEVLDSVKINEGISVIVRTAGMGRTKTEIIRDYEYLIRLWDNIRELTLSSNAPALVYEEGNVVKRALRDLYNSKTEEVLIEGEAAHKAAKEFMKMMMPSHANKIKLYKEPTPIFYKYGVEDELLSMHNPVVHLSSGGYIVIAVTEALIAIDVNSGRSTGERNIESTATRTNLEAAEEIARQLRLRDLAGLIVIDFIDMMEVRNRKNVEKSLKEALKMDRARIQVGRISPFGLLEMSRQRLRPSLTEINMHVCAACNGAGIIRSTESTCVQLIHVIENEVSQGGGEGKIIVTTTPEMALYLLNNKRHRITALEQQYNFSLTINADASMPPSQYKIEKIGANGQEKKVISSSEPVAAKKPGHDKKRGRGRDRDRDRDRKFRKERGERDEEREVTHKEEQPQEERQESDEAPEAASEERQPREGEEKRGRGRRRFRRGRGGRGRRDAEGKQDSGSSPHEEGEVIPSSGSYGELREEKSEIRRHHHQPEENFEEREEGSSSSSPPKKGWWRKIIS